MNITVQQKSLFDKVIRLPFLRVIVNSDGVLELNLWAFPPIDDYEVAHYIGRSMAEIFIKEFEDNNDLLIDFEQVLNAINKPSLQGYYDGFKLALEIKLCKK